jgi:hypothetical protein
MGVGLSRGLEKSGAFGRVTPVWVGQWSRVQESVTTTLVTFS